MIDAQKLKDLLNDIFECPQDFIKLNINGRIYKSNVDFKICAEEKISKENLIFYQMEIFYDDKVRHVNFDNKNDFINELVLVLEKGYKQCDIYTTKGMHKILMNKKNFKHSFTKGENKKKIQSHNKEKNYILKEGVVYPFLVGLDLMSDKGVVYKSKYKKFVQINQFLEQLSVITKNSNLNDNSVIVDVGCGKSYLTFALYYFFNEYLGKNYKIIGIDIKSDVIEHCNNLKDKIGYKDLEFYNVSIEDFKKENNSDVNMVVSLHACDTATDYALYSGVLWDSDIIMSVPCCHKELAGQVKNDLLFPLLSHGILKEKFQSLLCDSIRGLLLESKGFKVTISEFIKESNTPKNTLIVAYKDEKVSEKARLNSLDKYEKIAKEFNIKKQTLYDLLYLK
ncbi:MAG: class I SAM-dependent methyltransferase [Lachnospirales bacterium]